MNVARAKRGMVGRAHTRVLTITADWRLPVAQIPASTMRVDPPTPLSFDLSDEDPLAVALLAVHGNVFNGESLEAIFRGSPPGIPLLAVTSRRLMMLDTTMFEDRSALISVPLSGVSGVAFVTSGDQSFDATTTVGMVLRRKSVLLVCESREEARELHDMLIWTLTS